MRDNELESQSLSVCRSARQHGGQGSCQHLARKDLQSQVGGRAGEVLSPAGQSLRPLMPKEISVAWRSTLVCGAGLSQQWSGACLSYTLRVVDSTLLGPLISVLAQLLASGNFPRILSMGGPALKTWPFWSHAQIS